MAVSKAKVWSDRPPTDAEVAKYEYLEPAVRSLFEEMKELSKKKPDGVATAFKLRLINKSLSEIRELLYGDPSLAKVEELTEESLPQYSDIVLVLGQFSAALQRFHERFYDYGWQTVEAIEMAKKESQKK